MEHQTKKTRSIILSGFVSNHHRRQLFHKGHSLGLCGQDVLPPVWRWSWEFVLRLLWFINMFSNFKFFYRAEHFSSLDAGRHLYFSVVYASSIQTERVPPCKSLQLILISMKLWSKSSFGSASCTDVCVRQRYYHYSESAVVVGSFFFSFNGFFF